MHSNTDPTTRHRSAARLAALVATLVLVPAGLAVAGPNVGDWETAQKLDEIDDNHPDVNTAALEGCPAQSPDGLSLYLASNRPGGQGGLDIWVATRQRRRDPWGAPQNLPAPINSAADDFCPTPIQGDGLVFVSRRVIEGVTCGLGDIYTTRRHPRKGWQEPYHLACAPAGPNSDLDEQGPSLMQGQLYFSRSSATVAGELFVSDKHGNGFGPASPILELNDPTANDIQPNVRKDGRELVFSSNRAGGFGAQDIWAATRSSVHDDWSTPVNLGPNVNTSAGESRPWLSRHADQLLFGRGGPAGTAEGGTGAADLYLTTRQKSPHP